MTDREADRKDDDAWLDALRGRSRAGTDESTRREAQATRRALLEARSQRDTTTEPDSQELQRLLFRLRREGLIGAPATANGWRLRAPVAVAAALALGLALTLTMPTLWLSSGDDGEVLRGSGSAQTIEVADVPATLQQLDALLRTTGALVAVTDIGNGATEVSAILPGKQSDAFVAELGRFGVKPPGRDGVLRIDVRPKNANKK